MRRALDDDALTALQRLAQLGELTPDRVVEVASEPTSPLHELFVWDDEKAGAAYRVIQARDLIRSVRVELVIEERVLRVPKYVHDPDRERDEQGYVELTALRTETDRARAVVRMEIDRATSALKRANRVAEALGLTGELDSLIERATVLGDAIDAKEESA